MMTIETPNGKRQRLDRAQPEPHRFLLMSALATTILAASLGATVLFWLLYPYKTVNIPRSVMTQRYATQGSMVSYTLRYEKFTTQPALIRRRFVDGLIFNAGEFNSDVPPGKGLELREVRIPKTLPPGRYRIQEVATYQVNPIRTITVVSETDVFTVTEDTSAAH